MGHAGSREVQVDPTGVSHGEKVPISDVNELLPDPYSRASYAALVRDLEADG